MFSDIGCPKCVLQNLENIFIGEYLRLPKQLFQVSAPNDQTMILLLTLKFRDLFLRQLRFALGFVLLLFCSFLGSN